MVKHNFLGVDTYIGFFAMLQNFFTEHLILFSIDRSPASIVRETLIQLLAQVLFVQTDLVQAFQFFLTEMLQVSQHRLVLPIFAFQIQQILLQVPPTRYTLCPDKRVDPLNKLL